MPPLLCPLLFLPVRAFALRIIMPAFLVRSIPCSFCLSAPCRLKSQTILSAEPDFSYVVLKCLHTTRGCGKERRIFIGPW